MALNKDFTDYSSQEFSSEEDLNFDEDLESSSSAHKRRVRQLLDEKLEKKRLKEEFRDEFDEVNGEFDWDDYNK